MLTSNKLQIIDFHTHTFPDNIAEKAVQKLRRSSRIRPFSDGTAEGLRKTARKAGIGLSVIAPVATSPKQVEHINSGAIRMNREEDEKKEGSRLLSFGCIHPEYEGYREELRRIAGAGVPGIKLHAYFQGCDMDDIRYLRILDAAAENGLIVLAHAGYDQGFPGQHNCTVPMLHRVMNAVKGITLVAAHMGGWKEWEQVPELLAGTDIYIDTSFATGQIEPDQGEEPYWGVKNFAPDPGMTSCRELAAQGENGDKRRAAFVETAKQRSVFGNTQLLTAEQFTEIVRAFPEDHVLFATDSPWSSAKTAVDFVRNTSLTEEQKKSILDGAAEKLLRLNRHIQ